MQNIKIPTNDFLILSRTMLHCVLPTICRASKANPPNDCLFNAIVSGLLRHPDDFHSADYCSLIFDQFLFTWLPQESVLHHSLRLLWFTHVKIESSVMVGLLTTIQPTSEVCLSEVCYHNCRLVQCPVFLF